MLQSKHSEAFLAVAETGSFEQAAIRLNITASAVTLPRRLSPSWSGSKLLDPGFG